MLHKLNALQHLVISMLSALVAYFLGTFCIGATLSCVMLSWIVFCGVHLFISWRVFLKSSVKQTQQKASREDENRTTIFFLVVLATFAGLMAVFILLSKTDNNGASRWLNIVFAMLGMFLSWILVHTIYTAHYAHLYYQREQKGLTFPNQDDPDFLDFAYYSFVIGMTFQVSDVSITSKKMRQLTLAHSLISFVFNTCIVALTINAVAGLLN